MNVSIVTIVHGRKQALFNLIKGISSSIHRPAELVIVHMNEAVYQLPKTSFPIVQTEFHKPNVLPLAAARNFAIEVAQYQEVVFLDVDCIPSADLIGAFDQAFRYQGVLWSGRIRYLGPHAMEDQSVWDRLEELSIKDPVRGNLDQFAYENFWSLNFGCSKETFYRIGGFDEAYKGYGGEDTDFAFSARKQGVEFKTIDAVAYHQHHPSYDPPLNHLKDIVTNAITFKVKWGIWPMTGWLKKFERMGFISSVGDQLKVIRYPDAEEVTACLKAH